MPKVMIALTAIALFACSREVGGSDGKRGMKSFEEISDVIMNGSFIDTEHLSRTLAEREVAYILTPVSEDYLMVNPTSRCQGFGSDFKLSYLRLEGVTGPKIYRYRLYWQQSGPLCIEEDFAFANPYQ